MQKRGFAIGMMLAVVAGVGLRLWLMWRSGWRIEYDEAMLGIMATHIMNGEHGAFIPAQATLGSFEVYIAAGLFHLFGVSAAVLRVESLLYAVVYVLAVGWLGTLAFDRRVGVLAALLAAIAPVYLMTVGAKIWAGTMTTLTLGTVFLGITVQTLTVDRRRNMWWGLWGLLAGVLFWTAFLSAYYLIPMALVVAVWGLRRVRTDSKHLMLWAGVALVGFFVGSWPFWWHNMTHDWVTFRLTLGGESSTGAELWAIGRHLWGDIVPRLASGASEWGGLGRTLRQVNGWLYAVGLGALVVAMFRRGAGHLARVLVGLVAVAVPVIYVTSDFARNALNPFGIDATGRYVLMWHSVWPIGLAALAVQLRKRGGVVLVGLVLTLNLLGALTAHPTRIFDSPYYDRLPDDLTPLIDTLTANDVRYVWTDVGIAQPLIFHTQEHLIAADYWDTVEAGGLLRFPRYFEAVLAASENGERVAYVEAVRPEQVNPPIEQALDAANVDYDMIQVGNLRVYLPHEALLPADILGGLGYQH